MGRNRRAIRPDLIAPLPGLSGDIVDVDVSRRGFNDYSGLFRSAPEARNGEDRGEGRRPQSSDPPNGTKAESRWPSALTWSYVVGGTGLEPVTPCASFSLTMQVTV